MAYALREHRKHQNDEIIRLLTARRLPEARVMLNGYHDWNVLLARIQQAGSPALAQAALDVQFESWYSEDTNHSYREEVDVVRRLLALGARVEYAHLVNATAQNKMRTARLLLTHGARAYQAEAQETPLCNAAYWGDLELVKELVRRGCDVNQPELGGQTPVLAAAWSCQTKCVQYLLEQGADISLPYKLWEGNTQPIWKVIENRAASGADCKVIWDIVCEYRNLSVIRE
jgi:hypothetical protein